MTTVFGFDVGLASMGEAVRQGDDIVHADSLLIDANVATIQNQATRRRQYRTRQTHKMREEWWMHIWESIGKKPLKGIRIQKENGEWKSQLGDERLEREFPEKGDNTVYTSCLLRIALLKGEKLDDWQIYKAIRSAFIRAGYANVPWANNTNQKTDDDESSKAAYEFVNELREIFANEEYQLPCYYDAFMMGLFDPKTGKIKIRQNHEAARARGYTAPRELVEKELRLLLEQAAKQIPELKEFVSKEITVSGNWLDYILFGAELEAMKSTKAEGILNQKQARFDNRCVNNCSVIPRFKAIRAENIIYFQMHFLLKLHYMWVEKLDPNGKIATAKLNHQEILEWYQYAEDQRKKYMTEYRERKNQNPSESIDYKKIARFYKATKSQWKKWAEKKCYKIHTATCEVPEPRTTGRTGFSQAALVIIRELILSGMGPHDFHEKLIRENFTGFENLHLKPEDLDFLQRIKENDPSKFYIVPATLADQNINRNTGDLEEAVHHIIGSTRHSVVRHRLTVFFDRLRVLEKKYGTPDGIVIEFAREDFTPLKAKKEYENASKENNTRYKKAIEDLREIYGENFADPSKAYVRKYIMGEQQQWQCPYTGEALSHLKLDNYEIEHIIPQRGKWNGPDAIENTVLTTHKTNHDKGDRMPFEFIPTERWEWYKNHVENMQLSGKTKRILLCTNAEEVENLIDRYYGLATTGWVARLARDIACVWFGWEPGAAGEKKKMHVVSGSLVGKVRRKYGLNKALNPFISEEDAKKDAKNREDDRHHALDAMVMTYLEEYARDIRKFDKLQLPEGRRDARYFEEKLKSVTPHKIARNKAKLGETAYRVIEKQEVVEIRGKKQLKKSTVLVGRESIDKVDPKKIIDPVIREQVQAFMDTKPSDEAKAAFFAGFRVTPDGPLVKKVCKVQGSPDNTKNLSKNPQARGAYYESKSLTGVGTLQHGVYLYSLDGEKWKVKPVYAFKSPYLTKNEIIEQGFQVKDDALFYPGCIIEITKPIEGRDLDTGVYTSISIYANGQMEVKSSRGNKILTSLSQLGNNFHFVR